MNTRTKQLEWNLASAALHDAWTDFYLSRQAQNAAVNTLLFYQQTAGRFLTWIEGQGLTAPHEVTARHVREYLVTLQDRSDRTRNAHARAIKTLLIFWHKEEYMPARVTFEMPKIHKKRLPKLDADQLKYILSKCNTRDRALLSLMADSGLRRAEVSALNWTDIDIQTGIVIVQKGKGGKARITRIGATTRRYLLAMRRKDKVTRNDSPVFRSKLTGQRLTGVGIMLAFRRLSARTGVEVTAHAMRRTFTILALRAGMDALHVQGLGGWTSLEMVEYYASLEADDLLKAHEQHSPVDNLK